MTPPIHPRFTLALLAASALAAVAAPALADGVRVKDAAARLIVIPENRRDVQVTVSGGDPRLPRPTTRIEGGVVVVDGGLYRRIESCGAINMNVGFLFHPDRDAGKPPPGERVMIRGVGPLTIDHLPTITAHVPMNAEVSADGAVWGEVGRTESLRLASSGCGDWRVDDVRGPLEVTTAGSGDVAAHRAGAVRAHMSGSGNLAIADVDRDVTLAMSGSGDVRAGRIGGRLGAQISGSGNVAVARADGPVDAAIRGSGDLHVQDGNSPTVAVSIAGSGDFRYGGTAGALNAEVAGSGDVTVARVTGPVSKSVAGSGDIHVGR